MATTGQTDINTSKTLHKGNSALQSGNGLVATIAQKTLRRPPASAQSRSGLDDVASPKTLRKPCTSKQSRSGLVHLNYNNLLLLFVLGSVIGLIAEDVYHLVVFREFQSRAGLVWGPFSPLYGVGAVVLTVALNRLWRYPGPIIFGVSALAGSVVEFACSWWMEHSFGAIAWDYSDSFLNIEGRVNFMFACFWGTLGYLWVRFVMPAMDRGFSRIRWKQPAQRIGTFALTIFLLLNITLTVQAFDREGQRAQGVPAATNYERFFDETFSSEWMASRFENLSIHGTDN